MGTLKDIYNYGEDFVNTVFDPFTGESTDQAIEHQTQATREANATQRYMYDQTREDNRQAREIGLGALANMNTNINHFTDTFDQNDFQKDPGYQFRMDEAQKALENSASARGMLNSGRTLKDLTRFSQDYASGEYNNAYNRFNADRDQAWNKLAGLAGVGQVATNALNTANQNYGNQVSANTIGMGNANASAEIAQTNRMAGMWGQGAQAYGRYAASDERVKTDITPLNKADFADMKKHLVPYAFKYISDQYGEGDWVGVMAQDLEKSKLGRTLVTENKDGVKQIDINKVMCLWLASIAEGGH